MNANDIRETSGTTAYRTVLHSWMEQIYAKGGKRMYGKASGISDTDTFGYCPHCGSDYIIKRGDGSAQCRDCGYAFFVVEADDSVWEDE